MPNYRIEELRQLIGRTFERDGKRRTVLNIAYSISTGQPWRVIWHDGDESIKVGSMVTKFMEWLAGAKEVTRP